MILKYLHQDGTGKVYAGLSQPELEAQSFCVRVFGVLERPLLSGERINATDGSIETTPKTAGEIDAENKRQAILNLLANLDAGTATNLQHQRATAHIIRKLLA